MWLVSDFNLVCFSAMVILTLVSLKQIFMGFLDIPSGHDAVRRQTCGQHWRHSGIITRCVITHLCVHITCFASGHTREICRQRSVYLSQSLLRWCAYAVILCRYIVAPTTVPLQATSRLVLTEETYEQTLEALEKIPLVPDCLANAQLEVRIQYYYQVLN